MTLLAYLMACHRAAPTARVPAATPVIPRDAARFSISSTNDTTVVFRPLEARWLRVGLRGHAVDPLQRDALIARLIIVSVDTSTVTARITGQISQVSTSHVVLMVRPHVSWWRSRAFLGGTLLGAIVGVGATAAAH